MIITASQNYKIRKNLYNTAERDTNDVIANAASALAVRLETGKESYELTDIDRRIISYSISNQPETMMNTSARKSYKRRSA